MSLRGALACGVLCAVALLPATIAPAEDVDSLQAMVSAARDEAGSASSPPSGRRRSPRHASSG